MPQPPSPNDIRVIAPNLKRRLSGVTATIVRLVPVQARRIGIVATGPGLPDDVPHLPLWRVALLGRGRWRVWHARRNTEMLLGLLLRHVLGLPLVLLFTSASQRRHTGYTRWLISRMDAVIATSARTARYLERPARVILHGINTESFTPPADRAALRARLGLPDGVLIGCYGRIRAQKGTDAFVRAMIAALPSRPDVTALVMGRAVGRHGAYLEGLKAEVAAAGLAERILFLPEVSVAAIADWYRALDLYVAPQRWEGFGLTPLEAMACGVPVVATRVGAFDEIVTPRTGALAAPDDIPAL
ncbi:MAG: glycosyltransferase family 4 protein, partial [Paracoccaceae bacterium]